MKKRLAPRRLLNLGPALIVALVFGAGLTVSTRAATLIVTNANDSGAGSLRQIIAIAGPGGDTINFAPGLSGATILLTSGQLRLTNYVTIDASALPAGIRINGNASGRIFEVTGGKTVMLDSLTLTNGRVSGIGGANLSVGTLTVNRCT